MNAIKKQAALAAGLTQNGEEFIGTSAQFSRMERYVEWLETHGRLPRDKDGLREMEPDVWVK